jgi:hypothetical protein
MYNATYWALGLSFLYLVTMALVTTTKNVTSALVFKVIPFMIGILCLIVLVKLMGAM